MLTGVRQGKGAGTVSPVETLELHLQPERELFFWLAAGNISAAALNLVRKTSKNLPNKLSLVKVGRQDYSNYSFC